MIRLRPVQAVARDRKGSAAAEMALVMPLLLILGFGCFELGNYFWTNHIVGKAVRDGARYAARQSFVNLGCGPNVTNAATETNIKNVTRTGNIAGGNARVRGWDNNEVTVTVECQGTPAGIYVGGIYAGLNGGGRTVTVTAAVLYPTFFARLGFNSTNLTVNGRSQAAVMGI